MPLPVSALRGSGQTVNPLRRVCFGTSGLLPLGARQHLLPSEADDVDVVAASDDGDTIAWHANDGSRSFNERLVATLADAIGRPSALDVWRAVRGREELGARGELGAREELGAHEELGAREELGALVFRGG